MAASARWPPSWSRRWQGDIAPVVRERVALGERFAGFGHGVYKHGDPRAQRCWKR